MAAQGVHLKETILGGDEALREKQIVEALCVQRGHAARITMDADWSIEPGKMEGAGDLRQAVVDRRAQPVPDDERARDEQQRKKKGRGREPQPETPPPTARAAAVGL